MKEDEKRLKDDIKKKRKHKGKKNKYVPLLNKQQSISNPSLISNYYQESINEQIIWVEDIKYPQSWYIIKESYYQDFMVLQNSHNPTLFGCQENMFCPNNNNILTKNTHYYSQPCGYYDINNNNNNIYNNQYHYLNQTCVY